MKKMLLSGLFAALSTGFVHAQNPVLLDCQANATEYCDGSANDPLLWNQTEFWNPTLGVHNLPESQIDLSLTAEDADPAALEFKYLLFLDLDNDGLMETVVGSDVPAALNGMLRVGNALVPGFPGGTLRQFDQRPVLPKFKYRFRLDKTQAGNTAAAKVVWASGPGAAKAPRLPYGTHKIKWFVTNSLGNQVVCEYTFTVRDCAPPEIFCFNGLSANIMPTGMLTLWASDFLQYATDNNGSGNLQLAIVPAGSSAVFPTDAFGNPLTFVTLDCDALGTNAIDLWVRDAYGNAGFCTSYLELQDNFSNCNGGGNGPAVCARSFCSGDGIEEVDFVIQGNSPSLPSILLFDLADANGCADFGNAIPLSNDFTIAAYKDDNPLNGVSYYDLVLLKHHLDGTTPFQSAWQYFAADINYDGAVTWDDTLDLQNLILGIYTELPSNMSWRFFVDTCDFSAPFPIACPQEITVADLGNLPGIGFAGIKIGDLSCDAIVNNAGGSGADTRGTAHSAPPLVLAAQPNPTNDAAAIPIYLPERAKIHLEVFDLTGRRTFFAENQLDAGWQALRLPGEAFPQRGVYAWRVQIGGEVKSGKILRE